LVPCLAEAGFKVRALDLPEFDLTDRKQLEAQLAGAGIVVNCAAFTNVDKAEEMAEIANRVNGESVGLLGAWAKRHKAHVIQISTDFVFDGEAKRPYQETDRPHPVNIYGSSKLKGEEAILQSGCHCAILRVQWSYGRHGVNFIGKLLERARRGGELKVVNDQFGAPTWTFDMARAILCLVNKRSEGIFHFANTGHASRFEVAQFVARKLGLTNPVIPCSSSEFPTKALRPQNSRFCAAKIQKILDHKIRPWEEALSAYLAKPAEFNV
jgi:dTDP-4-dehydrorhamnose reductase